MKKYFLPDRAALPCNKCSVKRSVSVDHEDGGIFLTIFKDTTDSLFMEAAENKTANIRPIRKNNPYQK